MPASFTSFEFLLKYHCTREAFPIQVRHHTLHTHYSSFWVFPVTLIPSSILSAFFCTDSRGPIPYPEKFGSLTKSIIIGLTSELRFETIIELLIRKIKQKSLIPSAVLVFTQFLRVYVLVYMYMCVVTIRNEKNLGKTKNNKISKEKGITCF